MSSCPGFAEAKKRAAGLCTLCKMLLILTLTEAVSEEPTFLTFVRSGGCVLKLLFLTLESFY